MEERFAVFGASNAAGWAITTRGVDYHISNVASSIYDRSPVVSVDPDKIRINLSSNPELGEGDQVVNAGFPGDTVFELERRFEDDVLAKKPTHLFLWSGLNDPVLVVSLLHGNEEVLDEQEEEVVEKIRSALFKAGDSDLALRASADLVANTIEGMIKKATIEGIQVLVGTLPPFSSTLEEHVKSGKEPMAPHFINEGLTLVNLINQRVTNLVSNDCVVDAYKLVVDQSTGLVRAEYSYGATVPGFQGDILHLNSIGQIQVARVVCEKIHKKSVKIVPPNPQKLRNG